MPPSGCYFSRDNKNYRLSGLENNRSSGLPPDRGLHSLRLDTQAVAALRCSLLPSLFLSSPSRPVSRSLFPRRASPSPSLFLPHPLVVIALSGPGTPFDAPEGPLPLFRPTVAPRNFFAAGCLAAASLSRDSLPTSSPNLHQTTTADRPLPLYILHIINYQSRSWTTNLAHPPSCRSRQPFRAPFRVSSVTRKIGEFIKQEIDIL